ncbi:hypothetical protein CK203_023921 [Vitis vinifera]|uniref:Uncharacterized protein n=1 Tax=Vitis vinifera TaxID=29760 RepID=A0A438JA25_VITVI|nr:hypothetical protein CK203_023921 [Vitis vinifera]
MLESKTNKASKGVSGPLVWTSFASKRKEISSSVEEASTSGNCSGSGNSNPQHWRRLWELALAKMSTPSRSRLSAMGDEGHFDWRKTMERLQLESERQMQSLLQEIRRLREENDVLQIQVSFSGPPHDQRSRGQWANSRHKQGAAYLGTIGVTPNMRNDQPG